MRFIDYFAKDSDKNITTPNSIRMLFKNLDINLAKFWIHIDRTSIRVDNNHVIAKLIRITKSYRGANPQETHRFVTDRLRMFSSDCGIIYPGTKQKPQNALLGQDYLFHQNYTKQSMFVDGRINNPLSVVACKLFHHDEYSLQISSYLNGESVISNVSLIGIDLPLIVACIHQVELDEERLGVVGSFSIHDLVYQLFYRNIIADCLNVAVINRFVALSEIDDDDMLYLLFGEYSSNVPYMQLDVTESYIRAKRDIRRHFKQLSGETFLTFDRNVPGINNNGIASHTVPYMDDYYMDELIWINAVLETITLRRIEAMDNAYSLKLKYSGAVERVWYLLKPSRLRNYIRHLPPEMQTWIKNHIH